MKNSLSSGLQKLNYMFITFKIDWLLTANPDPGTGNTTGPFINNLICRFEGLSGSADREKGEQL